MAERFQLTAQLRLQAPTNTRQVLQQMRRDLKGISVDLQLKNATQTTRSVQKVNSELKKSNTLATQFGKSLQLAGQRAVGLAVATRVISTLTTRFSNAVASALEFERELVKISQVTGKTLSQLKGLSAEVTRLSTTLGVSSNALIGVSRQLSQAGFAARDLNVALRALAKTELAPTFDDISKTAEGAIAIFNQFKQGAGALEAQLGAINAVAGKFAVESGDLIGVVRRVGGVFKQAGGDLNELIALFTSVRATTRESAESIATGLRTIFTRIQRPKTIKFLRDLGVELKDAEGRFVGPIEAVKRLNEAFGDLPEGSLLGIQISEEIAGFRQIGKVIPLIKEFATAQAALGVATAGQTSLTEDSATAQQSLAVQFQKLREEYLALVRSFADGGAFRTLAEVALTLLSTLAKVLDKINDLGPALLALGGLSIFRRAGGLGGLLGGAGRVGGKLLGFNQGGVVPGVGNTDTVPAMLTPGEFVIKKSSVKKLGAGNLAAMNENRLNRGGVVVNPGAIGGFFLNPQQGERDIPIPANTTIDVTNRRVLSRIGNFARKSDKKKGQTALKDTRTSSAALLRRQALLGASKSTQERLLFGRAGVRNGQKLTNAITDKDFTSGNILASGKGIPPAALAAFNKQGPARDRIDRSISVGAAPVTAAKVPLIGNIKGFFPGGEDLKKNQKIARIVRDRSAKGLAEAVRGATQPVSNILNSPVIDFNEGQINTAARKIAKDPTASRTTEGFVFEGIIQGITGAILAGNTSNFDFPASSISSAKPKLSAMFTSGAEGVESLVKADAKRSVSSDSTKSIIKKIKNDINQNRLEGLTFRNSGGGISGQDTVPALLTPGEFVINKKAAQRIGTANLNTMNKKGVAGFNKGGPVGVQRLQGGGPARGGAAGFGDQLLALTFLPSIVEQFATSVDENGQKIDSFGNRLVDLFSSMLTTLLTVNIALQAFGVNLALRDLAKLPGVAKKVGSTFKDLVLGGTATREVIKRSGRGGAGFLTGNRVGAARGLADPFPGVRGTTAFNAGRLRGAGISRLRGSGRAGQALTTQLFSKGLPKALTKTISVLGKLGTGVGAVLVGLDIAGFVFDKLIGNTQKYNQAIEEGNVKQAENTAILKESNGFIQFLDRAGGILGFQEEGGAGLSTAINDAFASLGSGLGLGTFLGRDSSELKALAAARAGANKALIDNEDSVLRVNDALDDFRNGLITQNQLLTRGNAEAQRDLNKAKGLEDVIEDLDQNQRPQDLGVVGNTFRGLGRLTGIVDTEQQANAKVDAAIAEQRATQEQLRDNAFDKIEQTLSGAIGDGRGIERFDSLEDFLDTAVPDDPDTPQNERVDLQRTISSFDQRRQKELREIFTKEKKIREDNLKSLRALNLGISDLTSLQDVRSNNLTRLRDQFEGRSTAAGNAASILKDSIGQGSQFISDDQFKGARGLLKETLVELGADQTQFDRTIGGVDTLRTAQKSLPGIIEDIAKKASPDDENIRKAALKGGDILDLIGKGILKEAKEGGADPESLKRLSDSFKSLSEEDKGLIQDALDSGNFEEATRIALDPLREKVEESVEVLEKRAKLEQQLQGFLVARIKAENELVQAQQKTIDLQLEAAKIIAEAGGPKVSPEQEFQNRVERFNVQAERAGIQGVSSGSPEELRRAGRQIVAESQAINQRGFGGGGFGTQEDAAKRDRLNAALDATIQLTRDRIKAIQEELNIIKQKNAAEKSALDALLAGDTEGFLKQEGASLAAEAIRSGNTTLLRSLDQSDIAAGLKSLEGQISSSELFSAARTAGLSERQARVFSGTTQEERALNRELRDTASVLPELGQRGEELASIQVQNAQIAVTQAEIFFTQDSVKPEDSQVVTLGGEGLTSPEFQQAISERVEAAGKALEKSAELFKQGTDALGAITAQGGLLPTSIDVIVQPVEVKGGPTGQIIGDTNNAFKKELAKAIVAQITPILQGTANKKLGNDGAPVPTPGPPNPLNGGGLAGLGIPKR